MSKSAASLPLAALTLLFMLAACGTSPPRKDEPSPVSVPALTPSPPALSTPPTPDKLDQTLQAVSFSDLPGWQNDDLRQAWPAWLASCEALVKRPRWQELCQSASLINGADEKAVRAYFETRFVPHKVTNPDGSVTGMVTGYYEPLLRGARKRGGLYQTALYRPPEDLLTVDLAGLYPELKNLRLRGRIVGNRVVPYSSRADLVQQNALVGKELLWVDNAVEAFFLQVQGSGRVYLEDTKETVRLAYADQNGHPYKSIGRYLVNRGEMTLDQASAQSITAWAAANPEREQELLNANPSFVFFREEKLGDPSIGPKGALAVPLTPQRSLAVDPQFIPLGSPVFLASTLPGSDVPLRRLMMAQDTGGAIRSPVRADFFWGFGADAGELAGKMKQAGMLWVMIPHFMLEQIARQRTAPSH